MILGHLSLPRDELLHQILKDRLSIFQDGLGNILQVSWAPFGCSWGSLGRPLEAPGGSFRWPLGASDRPQTGGTH